MADDDAAYFATLDEDDAPELTEELLAQAKRGRDVVPEHILAQFPRSRGRPKALAPKKQVTLRVDADLLEHFRSQGDGWQTRLNAALRRGAGL